MPTVAVVDGIKIQFYFHAGQTTARPGVGLQSPGCRFARLVCMPVRRGAGEYSMSKALRVVSVEPVIHGVLKIIWTDGYEGVVDLRPVIARGRIFSHLNDPEAFSKVQLEQHGHHIYWINDKGQEIDFGADGLRETAERQAQMHTLMTG
jgi:hypothetical protein